MFGIFGGGPKLSVADVQAGVDAGNMVLVDCRDTMELKMSGKAKGAIHVPLAAMAMKANPSSPECLPEFKSGKPIVLYCASGARAAGAANMLRQMGHKDVENLGGLNTWASQGGDVVAA